jgi:hypothetical protein
MWNQADINLKQIDLRKEFEGIENEFKFDVLLVRTNNLTRCKCYDPLHGDGNRKCRICGGSGRVNLIEKVPVVHENVNTDGFVKMTELGLSASNTIILYMNFKIMPKVRDKIFIVGYDKYKLPIDIKRSCTVMSAEEVRGENGRVEGYLVYAKYTPEQILLEQRRLNAIPPKSKSEIMKGKRYTWPIS